MSQRTPTPEVDSLKTPSLALRSHRGLHKARGRVLEGVDKDPTTEMEPLEDIFEDFATGFVESSQDSLDGPQGLHLRQSKC